VTVGAYKYSMICPKFKQNIIQNQCPEFLVHFQKQWGNSVMILASYSKSRSQ
jgi:hypothetical protein